MVRIDKWLWCVRLYKTRSLATEACKKGKILINGDQAKPSRTVKTGDIVSVRHTVATLSFKLLQEPHTRMGAKLVADNMRNVTSPDQLEAMEVARLAQQLNRPRGAGRPTKKDRRDIDELFDINTNDDDQDWEEFLSTD